MWSKLRLDALTAVHCTSISIWFPNVNWDTSYLFVKEMHINFKVIFVGLWNDSLYLLLLLVIFLSFYVYFNFNVFYVYLRDSYEVYLKEVDSFHSKESVPSSCFDQGVQSNSQFFGVVALDKGSNTSMISFVDISPDDEAELPLEKASYVTEDARDKDMEDAYFITIGTF